MTRAMATAALVAAAMAAGCHLVTPFEPSASHDADGDADAEIDGQPDALEDADADEEGGPDGDVRSGPGTVVQVVSVVKVATDRVCDVDGDGILDNSIADLGEERSALFAVAFSSALDATATQSERPIIHFAWIDDLAVPESERVSVACYTGRDADFPLDPSDNLSGSEPFYADFSDLDSCGEPRFRIDDFSIVGGAVSGGGGTFTLAVEGGALGINISELSGTLAPGGRTLRGRICGFILISEIDTAVELALAPGLTLLEVLLAGGSAFGVPLVPGLSPDVDRDGDGIESFVLDDEDHIVRCIDGDHAIIEGRDCWQDPRIADGFSVTFDFEAVEGRYAGGEPGWEYKVPVGCAAWPPAESFFDTVPRSDASCAGIDDRCDPLAERPCCDEAHRCSGANLRTYRCYAPCESPRCAPGLFLASCHDSPYDDEPLCWPVDDDLPDWDDCVPGDSPCTTVHGETTNTVCISVSYHGPYCVQRCSAPTDGCGLNRRCVPSPFEEGGLCAYEAGFDPERFSD